MIPLKPFAIQYSDHTSKEASAIIQYCIMERHPYKMVKETKSIHENFIPVGSVEFCIEYLGVKVTPDYYPDFLKEHLHREVYRTSEWPLNKKVFIKPSDKYKRFNGFITNGGYRKKKKPPYWCSEVVDFVNEWRYYVSNGEILTGEWYYGDEINTPNAPEISLNLPEGYCGCIDFGELSNGNMALVEAQHPFACGWYGKDYNKYTEWIVNGWEYMLKYKETVT